jgi:TolB-like protein/Tfp pilus assembly protein PilF
LIQLAIALETSLGLPTWFDGVLVSLILLGFPVAMVFAWAFELTPNGVKRTEAVAEGESIRPETGSVLEYIIIGGLALVGGLIIWQTTNTTTQPTLVANDPVSQKSEIELASERPISEGISIAILPFDDLSAAGDQEYFSDGMSEEILNSLIKVKDLRVAGRTSSFAFKNKQMDMREIGTALNVTHILEGSVRKQDQRVRISAQLINVASGLNIWSETYDGTLDDIFDLQEEVSRAIAGELKVELHVGDGVRFVEKLTDNQTAYDLYLQGRALRRQIYGVGVLDQAVKLLEEAVALDPQFALAWVALGDTYYAIPKYTTVQDLNFYTQNAERCVKKTLELDPSNPYAHGLKGSLLRRQKDFAGERKIVEKLGEQFPDEAIPMYLNGYTKAVMGQTKAAIPFLEKAVEFDPVYGEYRYYLGVTKFNLGDLDAAEEQIQRSIELGVAPASFSLARIAHFRGYPDLAIELGLSGYDAYGKYLATQYNNRAMWVTAANGWYSGKEADRVKLISALDAYLQSPSPIIDLTILHGYLLGGEPGKFMELIDQNNVANPDVAMLRIWGDTQASRNVRQHPDFQDFAARNGLLAFWQTYGWPDKCRPLSGTDGSDGQFSCT